MQPGGVCLNIYLLKSGNTFEYQQGVATMTAYEQRLSLLEFLYRKPGVNLPELAEAPGIPESLLRDVFDELQRSKI